jgi:hypothetical protein
VLFSTQGSVQLRFRPQAIDRLEVQVAVQDIDIGAVDLDAPGIARLTTIIRELLNLVAGESVQTPWDGHSAIELRCETRPNDGAALWLNLGDRQIGETVLEGDARAERCARLLEELTALCNPER